MSKLSASSRVTPKKWSGGWLPSASLRLEMVVVLHLAAPNGTFHVLAHVSILAKFRLRDVAARGLSSLDLIKDLMVASSAYKMDWFSRSYEMSSMKMINRRGLVWSLEIPQHWCFSLQTLSHSGRPSVICLWDYLKTQCREFLKQTRVPHTVESSTDVTADDPCFFSVVEWFGKTLRDIICQSIWCRVPGPIKLNQCRIFSADSANAFSFYEVFCEQHHLQSGP